MNLTRDEIENMPAGREMDAQIERHVLKTNGWIDGYEHTFDAEGSCTKCKCYIDHHSGRVYLDGEYIGDKGCPNPNPHSSDIACAWKVVEKMKDDGWFFQLFDVVELPEWMARFTDVPGVGVAMKDARGYADTAPLAICRAALIAVMEAK